jgi:glycosyltransferase involved in cell wall biosynthesis
VVFAGYKDDVNTFLKNSSFFIHPAIEPDPLPTVILESIVLDVPVIATNLGGAIEILNNGKGGLLIPANNVASAVNLIMNFINDEQEIKYRKSIAQKHLINYFSNVKFKENILSLFEQ